MGKILKWFLPLTLVIFLIFCGVQYSNTVNIRDEVYKDYNSIEELKDAVYYDFDVPEIVKGSLNGDESTIRLFGNELVIIEGKSMRFRVAPKVQEWADVLGIEYPSDESYYYEVEDNGSIKYLRYRTGYKDNTSAYNWYTNELMYGIILDSSVKLDDFIEELNIQKINELNLDGTRVDPVDEVNFKSYTSSNGEVNILIPETNTELIEINSSKSILFKMENNLVMFITSDKVGYDDEFYECHEVSGYVFGVIKDNPFTEGTNAYDDLEIIKDNKDRIVNTIAVRTK